ncbi:hypothetical protein C0993_007086 [Termitomyces sp. T159_Od127]|nr:hypothetical protein C0993_007086 [Termitomyces sp. T159_Od127]
MDARFQTPLKRFARRVSSIPSIANAKITQRLQTPVVRASKRGSYPLRSTLTRRDSDSSLPLSSPPVPFSDTDDDIDDHDAVRDA